VLTIYGVLLICNGAVRYGRVNILDWRNNIEYPNCFNIKLAAKCGQLDAVRWLDEYELSIYSSRKGNCNRSPPFEF